MIDRKEHSRPPRREEKGPKAPMVGPDVEVQGVCARGREQRGNSEEESVRMVRRGGRVKRGLTFGVRFFFFFFSLVLSLEDCAPRFLLLISRRAAVLVPNLVDQ